MMDRQAPVSRFTIDQLSADRAATNAARVAIVTRGTFIRHSEAFRAGLRTDPAAIRFATVGQNIEEGNFHRGIRTSTVLPVAIA
jgi:hypothetical protein